MISLLSFLLVFSIIAIVHELGHLIAAKRAGIEVYEFALGIGPRIFGFRKGKTDYLLNLFPIGGYVKIAGIEPKQDPQNIPDDKKYYTKTPLQKFKTIVSGAMMNFLLGFIIIYFILVFVGAPAGITNVIDSIQPGSEAETIGLWPGDKIVAFNGKPAKDIKKVVETIHASTGKKLTLTVERYGEKIKLTAVPEYNENMKVGLIGFSLKANYKKIGPLAALWQAAKNTFSMIILLLVIVFKLIAGQIGFGQLAGPVGIAQISGQYAKSGLLSLFSFISFFSINVGVLNLLPIPALDGGRLVFVAIEAIRRKPIPIGQENRIHYWGMAFLFSLLILLTINDVFRLFVGR